MNLKKSISVILVSTAMCTAISGAVNACPGLEFAFGDQLQAHELMRRATDGAEFPSQNSTPHIQVPPMQVGDMRRFVFSVNNTQTSANLRCLGSLGNPVNDNAGDYAVTVRISGGQDNRNAAQPIPPQTGINGVPGLFNINIVPVGNALAVEFHAQGQCNVNGEIIITSNTSALPLSIPFNFQVN